jgi:hypothetical protein
VGAGLGVVAGLCSLAEGCLRLLWGAVGFFLGPHSDSSSGTSPAHCTTCTDDRWAQGEVFDQFLKGSSLEECYAAVAAVANRWLDMLDTRVGWDGGGRGGAGAGTPASGALLQTYVVSRICLALVLHPGCSHAYLSQGVDLTDQELIDHISEMCVMSKSLAEYEGAFGWRGGQCTKAAKALHLRCEACTRLAAARRGCAASTSGSCPHVLSCGFPCCPSLHWHVPLPSPASLPPSHCRAQVLRHHVRDPPVAVPG